MKTVGVGLLGFGTVGTGVIRLLNQDQPQVEQSTGYHISIEKVLVSDLNKERKIHIDKNLLTINPDDVLDNPNIDIIIEVMGGVEQTRNYLHRAFQNKKHVVTANKDLLAVYGPELLQAAKDHGCDLYYEASVAGGIPILRSLTDGLAADRIQKIIGIVNGTTNYILSKMAREPVSYEQALGEAQSLGFAEADPTSDVEGLDAARKMVILSHLAYSIPVDLDDVTIEGITGVEREDILYSQKLGYAIKLVGVTETANGQIDIRVSPTLLPSTHPLAAVENENNAVYVYGEAVGETMFYGPGAGELPTATAVVSDLISVVRNLSLDVNGHHIFIPSKEKQCVSSETIVSRFFFRFHVKDEQGAFSKISNLLKDHGISIEKLIQEPLSDQVAEVAIITHEVNKIKFEKALRKLEELDVMIDVKNYYRVEGMKR
ncbi:homoserine dehydrogenase [Terrilactibacillus laevilacticus]|uniref:Homoserine dehydrogenase n=1 Tax=Terrilactibacillus laevilacticus TaxID=1380157 RepID=A0ABW5PSC6_9BACI|nr:homoserine dehydrogenase [Terrilactibacillus laevilacticus]